MKKLLLALALCFWLPSPVVAQCNGVFPSATVCGNPAGAANIPHALPLAAFALAPGGTNGQVQTNNGAGGLAGITNTQLTADINNVTASLPGLIPAFPNNTTTFFRGDGTYAALPVTIAASAPKTTNYSIVNTDCNSAVTLGTGTTAQLTVALPSLPSAGFNAGCYIIIKNGDVYSGIGTGHAMTITGGPQDFNLGCGGICLWPGQVAAFQVNSAGNAWVTVVNPGRWILPQTAEICYTQNGSDNNDGLGSGTGCMAHVQTAVNIIGKQWDGAGYNACNIGIYAGGTNQVTESVSQTGQSVGCYLTVNVRGAFLWTTAGSCWTTGDNAIIIINMNLGFVPTLHCNNTNLASTCQFYGHQNVIWDINGSFEWDPQGSNDCLVFLDAQGRATLGLSTIVIGPGTAVSANSILNCAYGCRGLQISGTVAFSANVTLGQTFVLHSTGLINTTAAWTGSPTVSAASIPTGNSVLITNGTSIPGGTASATGGQVCNTLC
jgi:hypothetical protein